MARIRTIKPDFWTDEEIVELDPLDRLLFIGLWNFVDDQGFIDYRPRKIKMQVLPADDVDIPSALARLARASLVVAFEGPDGVVLKVRNWSKHQRVSNASRERFSPSDLRELPGWGGSLASPREDYPAEGKGRERKGRETVVPSPVPTGPETPHDEPPQPESFIPMHVLPRTWTPGLSHKAYALEHGVDLKHEHRQFVAHCKSKRVTSLDWDAEFDKWLGNAVTRARPSGPTDRPRPGASVWDKPARGDEPA